MSKIASRILVIPKEVNVNQQTNQLVVTGKNGTLVQEIPSHVKVEIKTEGITTNFVEGIEVKDSAILGTINSLVQNMLIGVSEGYEKVLEIKGVGYKVSLREQILDFSLGYSHNIILTVPTTLKVECVNNVKLVIRGADKQEVGWFAAKIRQFRKPSPFVKTYKGIFYQGEKIKIKSGKKEAKK